MLIVCVIEVDSDMNRLRGRQEREGKRGRGGEENRREVGRR